MSPVRVAEGRRLSLAAMVSAGVNSARAHSGLLLRLFLVELCASLIFAGGVAAALAGRFAMRPLFTRGIAGDDAALLSALLTQAPAIASLVWIGIAWTLGYAILSLYLGAGLLGAFAGRPFGQTAGERFGAFLRLWLLALIPWAIAGIVVGVGVFIVDIGNEDFLSMKTMIGEPLLAALPGLLVLAYVSCAVDYARARLVVTGGGAWRALGFGLRRPFRSPTALLHLVLYVLVWVAVSACYLAGTFGVAFAGAGGAVLLFALRQIVAGARFVARAATSAGQVRALEVEVLEARELVERAEPIGDVADAEVAKPIE